MMRTSDTQTTAQRVAILIDGDNISSRKLDEIVRYTAGYGEATVRKVFGDWTRSGLAPWKAASAAYGFRLVQATAYTSGKNTSDLAMVMEAMDILYQHLADTICIASSDGDFTGLTQRLRESGIRVIGFGGAHAPESLVSGCHSYLCAGNAHHGGPVGTENSVAPPMDEQPSCLDLRSLSREEIEALRKAEDAIDACEGLSARIRMEVCRVNPASAIDLSARQAGAAPIGRVALLETDRTVPTVKDRASVRQTEQKKAQPEQPKKQGTKPSSPKDPLLRDRDIFISAYREAAMGKNRAKVADINPLVTKKIKKFCCRNYGFNRVAKIYEALGFTISGSKKFIQMPAQGLQPA